MSGSKQASDTERADHPEPTLTLDCAGLLCPAPILALAKRFPEVSVGDVVAVLTTDRAALTDVPAWCRMRSQEYVACDEPAPGLTRHLVRRLS